MNPVGDIALHYRVALNREDRLQHAYGTMLDTPASNDHMINISGNDHRPISRDAGQNFDETTAALVHPADDSGPSSLQFTISS
ncbi:hypothetical protein CONLIGDRAFT_687627 [Coniochaeta ligniaria NRRL 30616]|uniref:Uncharacterized protein n=1 Tax=Coniochaeta ligniaria NRRL 30616 TaxID=1408157 RepID=A0A1J7I4G3_9PEZI|nr:hypothetical protein CONLIGDRAFT_687627 [Coniochaeta ligniaria NRRL 30616]